MPEPLQEIVKNTKELKAIEKEFLRFTYESPRPSTEEERRTFIYQATKIAQKAFTLRHNILADLAAIDTLTILDPEVSDLLKKIRSEKDKLYSIDFYKNLIEQLNVNNTEGEQYPRNLQDLFYAEFDRWFEEFNSWFDVVSFYLREIKVGPIVTASQLPERIKSYFSEVRDAYAYRLFRSSIVLCRSLLEMSLYDKLRRRGCFRQTDTKIPHIEEARQPDRLIELTRIARKDGLINQRVAGLVGHIRITANKILHQKEEDTILQEEYTLDIIRDTVEVLEWLYGYTR